MNESTNKFNELTRHSFANFRALKPIPPNIPEWLAPRESREKEPKWFAMFSGHNGPDRSDVAFIGMTDRFFDPRVIGLRSEWCVPVDEATRQKPVVLLTVDNPNYEG